MPLLFDSDFLKKLEYLALVSKRSRRGGNSARHHSRIRGGGGIEFAEHLPYFSGDDLRALDWNVYARFETLLLKQFEREEDLPVYFLVDSSESMSAGDPVKFDYARLLTAALAYIALANLDRVSVITFDNNLSSELPLLRGKENILSLLRFLEKSEISNRTTDLAAACERFVQRKQKRGLTFVLSDFFDCSGYQKGMDLLQSHQIETVLIQIHDKTESHPNLRGELRLCDIETSEEIEMTVNENILNRYRKEFAAFLNGLKCYASRHELDCVIAPTDIPFDQLILRLLRESFIVQ